MRVLVAEDSGAQRSIIVQMLVNLGFDDIVEAGDGQEAWEQLEPGGVDLLLTDWNMPRVNGLQLLQWVRQSDQLKDLPVVMLTTRNNREDIITALKAGINNYVTKPCKGADLRDKIDKAIRQQAQKVQKQSTYQRNLLGCRKHHPEQTGPYILCYETPGAVEAMERESDEVLKTYFDGVYEAIEQANATHPGREFGYVIEKETKEVMRRAADPAQQVGLLMISAQDETGLSLLRRIRASQQSPPTTLFVCASIAEIDPKRREAIAHSGASIVGRTEMDFSALSTLIESHLVSFIEEF